MNDLENHKIIKVIGVGGGAGHAVELLYKQGFSGASLLVCDTDSCALQQLSVPSYRLGEAIMKGIAEDGRPQIARDAALASADDIKRLLSDGTQMAIIIACMGGSAGTGAAPVIAQLAKEMGLAVVGIVTYPFLFETVNSRAQAFYGSNEMTRFVDNLSILYNEELLVRDSDFSLREAFPKLDRVLARAVEHLAGIAAGRNGKPICAKDIKTFCRGGFQIHNFIDQ